MKNRTLGMLALVGALVLLPLRAQAAVCINPSPLTEVWVIEIAGQGGPFFSLVGEMVGRCGPATSYPLIGSAHLRPDGKAHFGGTISAPDCSPGWFTGILAPPNFNSGSGIFQYYTGSANNLTFVPATCPTLPQTPGGATGPGTGTGTLP